MNSVKVHKAELLEKVKRNREAHRALFLKAQEGYRTAVIAELDRMFADAKDGKPIRRAISLPEPVDHTADYDRVISMLEMSAEDIVQISAEQFDQYVLDNWRWRRFASETNQWLANEAPSVNFRSAIPTFPSEESDRWGTSG
jgi:hypothetical protein